MTWHILGTSNNSQCQCNNFSSCTTRTIAITKHLSWLDHTRKFSSGATASHQASQKYRVPIRLEVAVFSAPGHPDECLDRRTCNNLQALGPTNRLPSVPPLSNR